MTINTELPAFPRTYSGDGHNGMTLRDYFAAKAMQIVLQEALRLGAATRAEDAPSVAAASYTMADAMLAAREVTK